MANTNKTAITTNQGGRTTMPNVTNNNFQEKFETGKLAEHLFYYIHGKKAVSLVDDESSRKKDTDFLVINEPKNGVWNYNSNEQFVRCEVKQDNVCGKDDERGNFFLEYQTVRPNSDGIEYGWTITCRANEVWYFDTMNKKFYVLDLPKIKIFLKNHFKELSTGEFDDYIDNSRKYGKLYRINKDRAKIIKREVSIENPVLKKACDDFIDANSKQRKREIVHSVGVEAYNRWGEIDTYNKCFGNYEIDNYIIRHRNTKCVQNAVDTLKGVFS